MGEGAILHSPVPCKFLAPVVSLPRVCAHPVTHDEAAASQAVRSRAASATSKPHGTPLFALLGAPVQEFGKPLVVKAVPVPKPGYGEVLIKAGRELC